MENAASQRGAGRALASSGPDEDDFSPDLHEAIELIGRRWAGAILWALAKEPRFFAELGEAVPGLSDRLLSRRLRELESAGLVERSVHGGVPPRVSYALTEKGRELKPVLSELREWALGWSSSS